jgi:hypothetical protein
MKKTLLAVVAASLLFARPAVPSTGARRARLRRSIRRKEGSNTEQDRPEVGCSPRGEGICVGSDESGSYQGLCRHARRWNRTESPEMKRYGGYVLRRHSTPALIGRTIQGGLA